MQARRELHIYGFFEECLNERVGEVDAGRFPVEEQGEDQQNSDGRPSDDRCAGFFSIDLKITAKT